MHFFLGALRINNQCRPRSDCFWRSSLIRVFPVCYSDKHFLNSSPDCPHFIWGQKDLISFDLILYVPVNNLSVMSRRVYPSWTGTKQGLMCLAQRHNAVTPVRLEPTALQSQVKHSTTEPLCSLWQKEKKNWNFETLTVHLIFSLEMMKTQKR